MTIVPPRRAIVALLLAALMTGCAVPVIPLPATPLPTPPIPPRALLTVAGGPPTDAQVGTYSWDGFAADAPWLPGGDVVIVPADILASVRFPQSVVIAGWTVEMAPLVDGIPDTGRRASRSSGATAEVDFPAPPAGSWSVRLRADFPGHGSVSYFWRFETTP